MLKLLLKQAAKRWPTENFKVYAMATSSDITASKISLLCSPVVLFEAMWDRVSKYWQFRKCLGEMSALSNSQLADLGLNRTMLKGIAYQATYGAL